MKFAGLLQGSRGVETFDTPERLAPGGRHYYPLPARFGLDAWRAAVGIHREQPQCRSAWTRR